MKWILLILLMSLQARADERYEFYNGVRSLSMGGAAVAVVNDETALLSNPAALGKLRNFFLTVADPELEIGQDTQAVVGSDTMAFLDPQETLVKVLAEPNKRLHERAQAFPSFVVTNFGFGVFARYSADAEYDLPNNIFDYNYRNDYAFVAGFNFRIWDGIIKIGTNARLINRVEVKRTDIPSTTLGMDFETVINSETVASEGMGVGTDGAVIITLPWMFLPSVTAVYRDIGGTSYTINQGMFNTTTKRPDHTPSTLDAGFSISPILSPGIRMTITGEMVDIMDNVEPETIEETDEIMRRIHGGLEFNFGDIFFLRGGMNQGYWTGGLEISMFNSQFQVGTYGEEIGDIIAKGDTTSTYTKREDRRYVFKYAYRF